MRIVLAATAGIALAGAAHAQTPLPIGFPADFAGAFGQQIALWNTQAPPLPLAPVPDPSWDPENPWPPNCWVCGQNAFLQDDATLLGRPAGTPVLFGIADLPLGAAQIANYGFAATQGPLIQVPVAGYGLAIPVRNAAVTANGGIVLNDNDLCGIFSGRLTDWSQTSAAGKAAPGPITVVYRRDVTGGGLILTAHFAKVCTSANSNFPQPIMPGSVLWGAFANGVAPANFVPVQSAAQMQAVLLQLPSAIGFLPPGWTSIAPKAQETSPLVDAALVTTNGAAALPNLAGTMQALNAPSGNAINAKPPTGAAARNPAAWVPQDPTPRAGYPLVGYETSVFSTCYTQAPGARINTQTLAYYMQLWLYWKGYTTLQDLAILNNEGLAEIPSAWISAGTRAFLKPNSLNLNIQNPAVCAGLQGR